MGGKGSHRKKDTKNLNFMDGYLIVGTIIGIVSQCTVGVHILYESAIDVQVASINEDYRPRCWEPMIEQQTFSFAIIWLFIFC